jgi:hypothetical protein
LKEKQHCGKGVFQIGVTEKLSCGRRAKLRDGVVKPDERLHFRNTTAAPRTGFVVRGAASRVTVNDTIKTVHQNESIVAILIAHAFDAFRSG